MSSSHKPAADAADDLDDLDDILDEFNAPAQGASKDAGPSQATSSSQAQAGPSRGAAVADERETEGGPARQAEANGNDDDDVDLNDQFARDLAQGMEALMRGVDPQTAAAQSAGQGSKGAPAAGPASGDGDGLMDEQEMMKQFEQMMKDMGLGGMGGAAGPSAPSSSGAPAAGGPSTSRQGPQQPANFQDAIRNTMSRLRESDATATSNASSANEMDFDKLLAAMSSAEGGEGNEEGIANMLESMMSELMSKEVLYDPLKELRDKYPDYLAKPPAGVSTEDRQRYQKQYEIVKQVIATFDDPKFDNGTETEKKALKSKVQELMNEMQDNGAPPQEIVGDLPPELENLPGLGGNDENCTIM